MLLLRIGKCCKHIFSSNNPSVVRWTTLNLRKPYQMLRNMKPYSRRLPIYAMLALPIVTASHKKKFSHLIPLQEVPKDPVVIVKTVISIYTIFRTLLRFIKLGFMFVPVLILWPISYASHILSSIWWDLLLHTVEMSGPVFIKLGQWAATRRDILSEDACMHLGKLQRQTKCHSWQYTEYCMEKAFGKDWGQIFQFKNKETPVGSGCVAQVYKAYINPDALKEEQCSAKVRPTMTSEQTVSDDALLTLAADGVPVFECLTYLKEKNKEANNNQNPDDENDRKNSSQSTDFSSAPVAIKILHPGIEKMFRRDIAILKVLAWTSSVVCPPLMWLSIPSCVNEFEQIMLAQLNLEREAENLEKFAKNFAHVPSIVFPKPIRPYVGEKVLVETFEDGKAMDNFLKADQDQKLRSKVAKIGVDAMLKMIFQDNFVHADLHPGNIIVQNADEPAPSFFRRTPNPLRLCILDCGVSSSLGPVDLIKFESVFKEVAYGDGAAVAELFLSKSEHMCSDPDTFKSEMNKLVTDARDGAVSLNKVDVGHLLQNVSLLLVKHRIRLESAFSSIVLAVFVLEGLGRSLDKEIDILERAQPFMKL